jgi:tight adherence protein C
MLLYAVFFGLLVGGAIICLALFFLQRRSKVLKRLQPEINSRLDLLRPRMETQPSFLTSSLVGKLEETLDLKKDSSRIKSLQQTLVLAGIYSERGIPVFLGIKLGLLLVLPLLGLLLLWSRSRNTSLMLGVILALCLLGYFLPNLILGHMTQKRQKKIRETLPDALDLMVVCVEAGQGLNAAIKRVADDFMRTNPTIAQELLLVNLEMNAGMERQQALRNLAVRTGVDEVASLCNILIQSDRFGTSVAQALKTQSDHLRTTRRLKLEELAAKTPVKLVFPLLLFIFPAINVVILGPAIIKISEFFK